MLTTLAAAALALTASQPNVDPNGVRPRTEDVPPMTVNVYTARGISPHLVTETLDEAGAIWNDAGITLAWRVVPGGRPEYSAAPHIVINDASGPRTPEGQTPVGWVEFRRPDDPDQEIHLSRANGMRLLQLASEPGKSIELQPPKAVDILLGRMLGRALAHELGHFLLRSRSHTRTGLMRGDRTVRDFITPGRRGCEVNAAQRSAVVARIREMTGADI
jgi:hypothetical protein